MSVSALQMRYCDYILGYASICFEVLCYIYIPMQLLYKVL
jgi:hypothetical protein